MGRIPVRSVVQYDRVSWKYIRTQKRVQVAFNHVQNYCRMTNEFNSVESGGTFISISLRRKKEEEKKDKYLFIFHFYRNIVSNHKAPLGQCCPRLRFVLNQLSKCSSNLRIRQRIRSFCRQVFFTKPINTK